MFAFHFPHLFLVRLQGGPHYFLHRPKLMCMLDRKITLKDKFQCSHLDYNIYINLFFYLDHNETQRVWAIELK